MKLLGAALIVLGVLAVVYGGISYNRQKTVLAVGPFEATAAEQHNTPLSPIVEGLALVSGLVLLMVPRRHTA